MSRASEFNSEPREGGSKLCIADYFGGSFETLAVEAGVGPRTKEEFFLLPSREACGALDDASFLI